jgi:hypothetical protein
LTRRDVLAAAASAAALAIPLRAHGEEGAANAMYFVPGGRIGFKRLAELMPLASSWHLLSRDHTLQVEVDEALRIDAEWDGRMWDQDDRHVLVASGTAAPGFDFRRFRDQRYGNDANYGADVQVLRDERWIGQVRVSTSTLGSRLLSIPGGQIARWRGVIDAILASITVRPSLAVSQALAEHRMSMALDGLNARLHGDQLILSLAPPQSPAEAAGITGSYISAPKLSMLPLGSPESLEEANNAAFDIYRKLPGSRAVTGSYSRGVVLNENTVDESGDPVFATTLMAFSRTRQLKMTAFYSRTDRERLLQALERAHSTLMLVDRR